MSRVLAVFLVVFSGLVSAQEVRRVPVYVSEQCEDDSVGQRLAFKVREGIRASMSMSLANSYSDSLIEASLLCGEPEPEERGIVSTHSYAITFMNTKGHFDYLLTYGIRQCGASRIDSCAESLVASIDRAILDLKKRIDSGEFKPFDP